MEVFGVVLVIVLGIALLFAVIWAIDTLIKRYINYAKKK